MSHGPLQGVKVISCSTAQAGTVPYMLMADLGADVIKIEAPKGGDPSRRMTVLPGKGSTFFETNNRGVKSVTLNLKDPEGRAILHKLVAEADIFGQNFRPGAAEKNGFGWEELRKINPEARLRVDLRLRHQGPERPPARHRFDGAGAGRHRRGLLACPARRCAPASPRWPTNSTAMLAFGGALAALHHARTTGVGQKIELSLLGSLVRLMGWTFTTTMWRDRNPVTGQARITGTARAAGHQRLVQRQGRQAAGLPAHRARELAGRHDGAAASTTASARRASRRSRRASSTTIAKRDELLALLDELFATGTREDWVDKLRGADIVSAPINTMLEASNDPDVIANGHVTHVEHPKHGKLKVHGTPWRFSETPAKPGIAPELGEHNESVLSGLGYDAAAVAELKKRGVI